MPKISTIMAVYNAEKYVKEAIDSVLDQSYKDFEFIIVDDCSSDKTSDIVTSYQDSRIIFERNTINLGRAISRNKCLEYASGEYITVIDADDTYLPNRFEEQIEYLDDNKEVGLVGGGYLVVNEKLKELFCYIPNTSNDNGSIQQSLLNDNIFGHGSVMYRRNCIDLIGSYRDEFRLAHDYDLYLRSAEHCKLGIIKKPLYKYRISLHQNSIQFYYLQNEYANLARDLASDRRNNKGDKLVLLDKQEKKKFLDERFLEKYNNNKNYYTSIGFVDCADMFFSQRRFIESLSLIIKAILLTPFRFKLYLKVAVVMVCLVIYSMKYCARWVVQRCLKN